MGKSIYADKVKQTLANYNKELNAIMEKYPEYIVEINEDDNENNVLEAYYNKKKILSAKYQILGIYDEQCNLFTWAKNIQLIDKTLTKISKKIKAMSSVIKDIIIKNEYSDIEYLEKIMYYLSNNTFIIYPQNINELINFSTFITKHKGVIKSKMNEQDKNIYIYYLITDIIGT